MAKRCKPKDFLTVPVFQLPKSKGGLFLYEGIFFRKALFSHSNLDNEHVNDLKSIYSYICLKIMTA